MVNKLISRMTAVLDTAARALWLALAALSLSLLMPLAVSMAAEPMTTRELPMPSFGKLELSVPTDWRALIEQPEQGLPRTLIFGPSEGKGFNIQITAMWAFRPEISIPRPQEIQPSITREAERLRPQAVARSVNVRELKGKRGNGYYFTATDKAPKPGELKQLTQGMVHLGNVVVAFTILTNDASDAAVTQALAAIRDVRFVAQKK